jgi:hypothetical protein
VACEAGSVAPPAEAETTGVGLADALAEAGGLVPVVVVELGEVGVTDGDVAVELAGVVTGAGHGEMLTALADAVVAQDERLLDGFGVARDTLLLATALFEPPDSGLTCLPSPVSVPPPFPLCECPLEMTEEPSWTMA